MLRTTLTLALAASALLFVPWTGCGVEDDEFLFGEPEMRQAVVGDWLGTLSPSGTGLHLSLEQATVETRRSGLCGNRSFVRPAAACIAVTEMPLTGRVSTDDGRFQDVPVRGTFVVTGAALTYGWLELDLGGAVLEAAWEEGAMGEASLSQGDRRDEVTLRRP